MVFGLGRVDSVIFFAIPTSWLTYDAMLLLLLLLLLCGFYFEHICWIGGIFATKKCLGAVPY